jgi:group I intron endonuclease
MNKGYIYKIVCVPNDKIYIGQTLRTIEKRWKRHIMDSKKSCDNKFHRAIRKYGEDNFIAEEVMWVEAPTQKELKAKLDFLECHFIQRYDTKRNGYNSTDGGDGVVGRICSEESRERYRQANLGQNNPSWGKRCSEATKEKVRQAHLGKSSGMKGKRHSEETKKRISEACSGKKNPNFGKHASEETRRKLSESHLGKSHTSEQNKKISDSIKRMWKNKSLNNFGYGQKN